VPSPGRKIVVNMTRNELILALVSQRIDRLRQPVMDYVIRCSICGHTAALHDHWVDPDPELEVYCGSCWSPLEA
jgi:hypothetical protein